MKRIMPTPFCFTVENALGDQWSTTLMVPENRSPSSYKGLAIGIVKRYMPEAKPYRVVEIDEVCE